MRVFCYFNLHKHCYSLRALDGADRGRVIAHAREAVLRDVRFKVSEAGRQKVLRERRKNVHAGVVGTLDSYLPHLSPGDSMSRPHRRSEKVTYNPYRFANFVRQRDEAAISGARRCMLSEGGVWAEGLEFLREANTSKLLTID